MRILVYGGQGVSAFSLSETLRALREFSDEVAVIDPLFLKENAWEKDTKLIVFPGGRDILYNRNLKGKGTTKIRRFVERGGSYLGICAGAYFGAHEVIFEKGTALEVHEKRDLNFFPGTAFGTLYPHAPFSYASEAGTHPSEIFFEEQSLHLYYNGGCAFKEAQKFSTVKVLASYLDAQDQPAVIHCAVGNGNVVLSGVHFEISPGPLKEKGCSAATFAKIKRSDESRKSLMNVILTYLI
ncbi:MAG: BPL-N domain-containing protein [Simkaniaceae bacterium]|nr:BPL-N domain-containing protein [Simkaniaceae bacterium]